MTRHTPLLVFAAPTLLGAFLWWVSGRERVTKSGKWVTEQVPDELFGGTNLASHWEPGPLLGYFVGLDFALGVAVAAALAAVLVWWLRRRSLARRVSAGGLAI